MQQLLAGAGILLGPKNQKRTQKTPKTHTHATHTHTQRNAREERRRRRRRRHATPRHTEHHEIATKKLVFGLFPTTPNSIAHTHSAETGAKAVIFFPRVWDLFLL